MYNLFTEIKLLKKSGIQETLNLSTDADSSTDIFVSAGVKKGADSICFCFLDSFIIYVVVFRLYLAMTIRKNLKRLNRRRKNIISFDKSG